MPLKAMLGEKKVYAWELEEKDREFAFKCPYCPSRLIPVLPTQNIIKHFRHHYGTYHSEPETIEHVSGQKFIYEEAEKAGIKAEPEVILGNHIVDVFLNEKRKVAIEYQCSNISSLEIEDRIAEYLTHGSDKVIWILGGRFYKNAITTIWWERVHRKSYKIQRIKKAEKTILDHQSDIYYLTNGSNFFVGAWKPRKRSKVLGWYSLYQADLSTLLDTICNPMTMSDFLSGDKND